MQHHAGLERARVDGVPSLDLLDDAARVTIAGDLGGDGPEGVTGLDHVRAIGDGCKSGVADTQRPADGPRQHGDEPQSGEQQRDAAANIRSVHASMVDERVFDVKRISEHMFAPLPVGC